MFLPSYNPFTINLSYKMYNSVASRTVIKPKPMIASHVFLVLGIHTCGQVLYPLAAFLSPMWLLLWWLSVWLRYNTNPALNTSGIHRRSHQAFPLWELSFVCVCMHTYTHKLSLFTLFFYILLDIGLVQLACNCINQLSFFFL